MTSNTIRIPESQVVIFGEVVRELQKNGLAFGVEHRNGHFEIEVTGH